MIIDGYRVIFEPGEGWRCECSDFRKDQACQHVIKAAALRTVETAVERMGASSIRRQ